MTLIEGNVPQEGGEQKSVNPTEVAELLGLLRDQKKRLDELEEKLQTGGGNNAGNVSAIVAEVLKGIKANDQEGITIRDGIQLDQIPQEDFDEKGTIFCAPSSGYVITDYFKMGHRIMPPYGIDSIYLEHKASRRKRDGKEHQIFYTSMYKSQSHKLTAWLKQHPLFNITFYESQKVMDSYDVQRAIRTAKLMNTIRDYDGLKIMKMCADNNVPRHDDIDVMRNQLVGAIIAKEHEKSQADIKSKMDDLEKERKLLGENAVN